MKLAEKQQPRYEGWKVTNEEYMQLEDDGFKYDMIDGVLYMAPCPFSPHSYFQTILLIQLGEFVKRHKLGKVFNELDVHLPDLGDVLRPDISFVLKQNNSILKKWIVGAPDLVCEVLSESTRNNDLVRKSNRYLSNGVKEYWIVDTDNKWIEVWYNRNKSWEKVIGETILKSEVLNGFILDTLEFFREDDD